LKYDSGRIGFFKNKDYSGFSTLYPGSDGVDDRKNF